MTFIDWMQETRTKVRRDPIHIALKGAIQELWVGALSRGGSMVFDTEGEPIWAREFDVCCVVDSCRWDLFAEVCSSGGYEYLPDSPEELISVGSMSPEWINKTFGSAYANQAQRAAYITANTFSGTKVSGYSNLPLDESRIGYLDEVWKTHWRDDLGEGISTIPPKVLTDKAIDICRRRDGLDIDQVVIHYMQPHTPFRSMPDHFPTYRGEDLEGKSSSHLRKDIWKRCRDGEISTTELWEAYRDNLEWVLNSIERLIDNCDGKVAITSDHGNGVGEWGVWGHPPKNPLSELRKVPWVTIDASDSNAYEPDFFGKDREITRETDLNVGEQLDALGYR